MGPSRAASVLSALAFGVDRARSPGRSRVSRALGMVLLALEDPVDGGDPGPGVYAWSYGRDPSEYGWLFHETNVRITGEDLYGVSDWSDLDRLGVPPSVLSRLRESGYGPEEADAWLQSEYPAESEEPPE